MKTFQGGLSPLQVIYTSNLDNKSEIVLLSENWEVSKKISLKVGGLGAILQKVTIYKNKLYVPATGIPSNSDEQILEFDLDSTSIRYLKAENFPIDLEVDNDFLYVIHNSGLDEGVLAQVDIKKNIIIKKLNSKEFYEKLLYLMTTFMLWEIIFSLEDKQSMKLAKA